MSVMERHVNGENLDRVVSVEQINCEYGRMGDGDMEQGNIAEEVLENLEEYLEDINDRLIISRMVSDSVIKGMVTAIEQEAAEKIATRELESANLKKFMKPPEVITDKYVDGSLTGMQKEYKFGSNPAYQCSGDGCENMRESLDHFMSQQYSEVEKEMEFPQKSDSAKNSSSSSVLFELNGVALEGQCESCGHVDMKFKRLKKTVDIVHRKFEDILLPGISNYELQRDCSLLNKVEDVVIQTVLRGHQEELEGRFLENNDLLNGVKYVNWIEKFNDLSSFRTQLDAILKALAIPETGFVSHGSHDLDPLHHKVLVNHKTSIGLLHDGNGMLDTTNMNVAESYDFQQLKHFTKEELVDFFNNVITKIRRDHERVEQKNTEDYFSMKREYLKILSLVTHSKDENSDIRKKIIEVISKVGEFLLENESFPALSICLESIAVLKKKSDSLLYENRYLKDCVTVKENDIRCLETEVSDFREKVSWAIGVSPVSNSVSLATPDTCKGSEGIFGENDGSHVVEALDIDSMILLELSGLVLTEVMDDVARQFNGLCKVVLADRDFITHLEAKVAEKENELHLDNEDTKKLRQEMLDLEIALENKELHLQDLLISLQKDRKQFELALNELSTVKDDAKWLQTMVTETHKGLELLRFKHIEELKQIEDGKIEIYRLNSDLHQAKVLLLRTRDERSNLEETVKRVLQMGASSFSHMLDGFESDVSSKMRRIMYRLDDASCYMKTLPKTANELKRTELICNKILEVRCADLEMAETEVDLLGDEVDALLHLLEKIYIALEHYSPVLKHYPGIVEILELIRRELCGESTKPY